MTDSFYIDLYRLEPMVFKGQRIDGFLERLPDDSIEIIDNRTTNIMEKVGCKYGGGRFHIKIFVDGDFLKSFNFDIAGMPQIGKAACTCSTAQIFNAGCICGGI